MAFRIAREQLMRNGNDVSADASTLGFASFPGAVEVPARDGATLVFQLETLERDGESDIQVAIYTSPLVTARVLIFND